MARRNLYLNKWIKHGGYYPDRKLRLVKREFAKFELRAGSRRYENVRQDRRAAWRFNSPRLPNLERFIDHANRYSSLGAQMVVDERRVGFSVANIVLRPACEFRLQYI